MVDAVRSATNGWEWTPQTALRQSVVDNAAVASVKEENWLSLRLGSAEGGARDRGGRMSQRRNTTGNGRAVTDRRRRLHGSAMVALVVTLATQAAAQPPSFITFESGPVRPLALSPDGTTLYAVNTPDNTLEIFDVVPSGLTPSHVGAGRHGAGRGGGARQRRGVGRQPPLRQRQHRRRQRQRPARRPHAARRRRAAATSSSPARRQPRLHHHGAPRPEQRRCRAATSTVAGIGRADVWVFDATNLGATLGGTPLTVVTLFGDTPRALAVSPDGGTVYAAVFRSGNQTTSHQRSAGVQHQRRQRRQRHRAGLLHRRRHVASRRLAAAAQELRRASTAPRPASSSSSTATAASSIGGRTSSAATGTTPSASTLPDLDVFAIDANAGTAGRDRRLRRRRHDALQHGGQPGERRRSTSPTPTRRTTSASRAPARCRPASSRSASRRRCAAISPSRASRSSTAAPSLPRHLNKHIDYADVPVPAGVKTTASRRRSAWRSRATAATLYVAAFGSARSASSTPPQLEDDTFDRPAPADHIAVTGGGPAGLVLDEATRLYVADALRQRGRRRRPHPGQRRRRDPERRAAQSRAGQRRRRPAVPLRRVPHRQQRRGVVRELPHLRRHRRSRLGSRQSRRRSSSPTATRSRIGSRRADFHPMKGPMTTQSLRGLVNMGPQHWRGRPSGRRRTTRSTPSTSPSPA